MKRPPQLLIKSKVPCPQCKAVMDTAYECKWDGVVTRETTTLKCKCGYEYMAVSAYGQQGD
jgi:hypothetical protein